MPTIPYHHLYNIHIPVIISRRAVDVFGSRFLSFMLAICFSLPPLLYDPFIPFLRSRVGPLTAVSAQVSAALISFP